MREIMPMCYLCKHYHGIKSNPRHLGRCAAYCDAYPDEDGIPLAVDDFGHFYPLDGDHGLQFEPKDDVTPEQVAFYRDFIYGADEEEEE